MNTTAEKLLATGSTPTNGVIRIGRKGRKKAAFGDDGKVFEYDVVETWWNWLTIDQQFRNTEGDDKDVVPMTEMSNYHQAAIDFCNAIATDPATNEVHGPSSRAEALEFLRCLREQYEDLAAFFRPRSRTEPDSPDSSGVELRFSAEES